MIIIGWAALFPNVVQRTYPLNAVVLVSPELYYITT